MTIHKCRGLSLDCAIINLSDRVFSAGMAYVALSRVRSLAGLHLTEFDPPSIKVSVACLKEVNRLRETFRKDLPLYPISSVSSSRKRKLTRTIIQADQALAKKLVKRAMKTVVTKVTKSTRKSKKSDSPDVQLISPPKKTLKSGKSQLGKHSVSLPTRWALVWGFLTTLLNGVSDQLVTFIICTCIGKCYTILLLPWNQQFLTWVLLQSPLHQVLTFMTIIQDKLVHNAILVYWKTSTNQRWW